MKHLKEQAEGKPLDEPEYFYGLYSCCGGHLHDEFFRFREQADEVAADCDCEVVILQARIVLAEDGKTRLRPRRRTQQEKEADNDPEDLTEAKTLFEKYFLGMGD